jgi:hypothetical protein
MKKILSRILILACSLCTLACNKEKERSEYDFDLLTSDKTGIDFANTLKSTKEINIFSYMYFYNGGGVGAGDLNNDGLIDLCFTANQEPNRIYLNKSKMKFEDITEKSNFKGGKGVATLLGMAVAIQPLVAVCCIGVFLLVLYLTRFVSLSSILASIAFPVFILVIFNVENHIYRVFAIAVALMVLLTHQKNIGKLLKGVESKVPIFKHRDRRRQRRRENSGFRG